jgi:hypothetical protein
LAQEPDPVRQAQAERLVRAASNPSITVIGHITGCKFSINPDAHSTRPLTRLAGTGDA